MGQNLLPPAHRESRSYNSCRQYCARLVLPPQLVYLNRVPQFCNIGRVSSERRTGDRGERPLIPVGKCFKPTLLWSEAMTVGAT
jgi:hypothetical protein